MRKMRIIAMSALITGSIFSINSVSAQSENVAESVKLIEAEEKTIEDASDYMKFSGLISNVEQNEETLKITVENQQNTLLMIYPITNEVLLLNSRTAEEMQKDQFEEGLQVDVYYDKHKPMTMIYPATVIPSIVIVHDQEFEQVKVSKFDKDFVSLDNELKLHLSEETVLENEQGEKIDVAELSDKELIVFYTASTKSIPAQTTPSKIILFDRYTGKHVTEVHQLIDLDHFMKNETKMVPIRDVAEFLGYGVEWKNDTQSLIVKKQNRSFTISVGEKNYGYNRSLKQFEEAPEIKNGKTYVSSDIVEMLVGN
ncbi:copper amine oxidase N-terminal domain-containing protein [bacterium LRH843]|nr:copper amine oxidase N-terminal domain-containing protein [bacterium LRH843]